MASLVEEDGGVGHEPSLNPFLRVFVRAFYNDDEILVFEQLLHSGGQVKEKVLENALNLRSKALAQAVQRLEKHSLVESKTMARIGITYRVFPKAKDVVFARMTKMQKLVQEQLDDLYKSEDYQCYKCGKTYDLLTAMTMTDPRVAPDGVFVCCNQEMEPQTHDDEKRSLSSLAVRVRDLLEQVHDVYDRVNARAKAQREQKAAQDLLNPLPPATIHAVKRPADDPVALPEEVKQARLEDFKDPPALLRPEVFARVLPPAQEVFVAGRKYCLTDVQENDDLLDEMTQEEFEAYQDIINS